MLELLWRHGAAGSASDLAKQARVSFSSAYRELTLMKEFGLVAVRVEDGREVYSAATDHRDAELLRRLVESRPSSAPPDDPACAAVRRRVRALGAPLAVPAEPVPEDQREEALVDAVRLARRDATLARVLPVALAAQWKTLDRDRLERSAVRAKEKHTVGFFLALTAELLGDRVLRGWAARFRDHRVKTLRPFFALPSARMGKDLVERRTPQLAREWGYSMDLSLDSFQSAFAKHSA